MAFVEKKNSEKGKRQVKVFIMMSAFRGITVLQICFLAGRDYCVGAHNRVLIDVEYLG